MPVRWEDDRETRHARRRARQREAARLVARRARMEQAREDARDTRVVTVLDRVRPGWWWTPWRGRKSRLVVRARVYDAGTGESRAVVAWTFVDRETVGAMVGLEGPEYGGQEWRWRVPPEEWCTGEESWRTAQVFIRLGQDWNATAVCEEWDQAVEEALEGAGW